MNLFMMCNGRSEFSIITASGEALLIYSSAGLSRHDRNARRVLSHAPRTRNATENVNERKNQKRKFKSIFIDDCGSREAGESATWLFENAF